MVTAKPISCVPQTPVTPCPTVKKDITSQSTTDSSGGSTKDPLAQHQDPNGGNSSGISGGKYQQCHNQFRYDQIWSALSNLNCALLLGTEMS